ncbi:MAG TPA: hypothetical protein VM099_04615, partial [Gemmatimonadaceae bacterium]|nr:hypothetical protein [Gemmatimonadaceae bacterium]
RSMESPAIPHLEPELIATNAAYVDLVIVMGVGLEGALRIILAVKDGNFRNVELKGGSISANQRRYAAADFPAPHFSIYEIERGQQDSERATKRLLITRGERKLGNILASPLAGLRRGESAYSVCHQIAFFDEEISMANDRRAVLASGNVP